jgi:hypothetical protein
MTYFSAVRHPWPCLAFLIPVLGVYEYGVARFAGPNGESLRSGVDIWIRKWIAENGSVPPAFLPVAILAPLIAWTIWRWKDRPKNVFTAVFGIALEGVVLGLALWAICLNAPALFDNLAVEKAAIDGGLDSRAITFLGVGVYEEVVFRLIGFALLVRILRIAFVPNLAAVPTAILLSAVAFSMAHHVVQSDTFAVPLFLTRVLIGVCLGIVYYWRGLGVAITAHIVYDVVVTLPRG